ncbi:MAG: GFA family protein [Pseudomonadota bacterium]
MAVEAKGIGEEVSYTGGCQCGAVRYEIAANALSGYACHCRECQKQSASAFGISVPVFRNALTIEGELREWTRTTDSGNTTSCYFCPKCGTRVFHAGSNRPGLVTIKGGSLDDIAAIPLTAHIWTKRRLDWVELPDDLPQFETQPQTQEDWLSMLGWTQ